VIGAAGHDDMREPLDRRLVAGDCPFDILGRKTVPLTNYSAIAAMFYPTLRPTIHIYPVRSADEAFFLETCEGGRLSRREIGSARFVWKMPPEEHGGLLARAFEQLLEQVDRALADPHCCEAQARSFLERHMTPPDGGNCERIFEAMQQLAAGARRRSARRRSPAESRSRPPGDPSPPKIRPSSIQICVG